VIGKPGCQQVDCPDLLAVQRKMLIFFIHRFSLLIQFYHI
jgi:hypothetical protein